jgi:hypothetical protein
MLLNFIDLFLFLFLPAVHNVHYADGWMLIINTAQASKIQQVKGKDHGLSQPDGIDDK